MGVYESSTEGLTPEEIEKATRPVAVAAPPNGKCIHLPTRPVYRTIKVRDSLRIMDLCEGCYGVMERAGCVAEIVS